MRSTILRNALTIARITGAASPRAAQRVRWILDRLSAHISPSTSTHETHATR